MDIELKKTGKTISINIDNLKYKFRVWNGNKMYLWRDIKRFGNFTKLMALNHCVVMQDVLFLGLYEYDIIEDNIGTGVIMYDEERKFYCVKYSNNTSKMFYAFTDSEISGLKLIGNIFENKELINNYEPN